METTVLPCIQYSSVACFIHSAQYIYIHIYPSNHQRKKVICRALLFYAVFQTAIESGLCLQADWLFQTLSFHGDRSLFGFIFYFYFFDFSFYSFFVFFFFLFPFSLKKIFSEIPDRPNLIGSPLFYFLFFIFLIFAYLFLHKNNTVTSRPRQNISSVHTQTAVMRIDISAGLVPSTPTVTH